MPKQPPKHLDKAGRSLWRAISSDVAPGWELTASELDLLDRAARCADELAELEATVDRDGVTVEGSRGQVTVHPALQEARQMRITLLRLLGPIETSNPNDGVRSASFNQSRARHAADKRWNLSPREKAS